MGIEIKSAHEINLMREAGRIVAQTLEVLAEAVRPGITTGELDDIAAAEIKRRGGISSFKGYRGYPASLCASVNEEVVHGIPGGRVLRDGDIVSLDLGAIFNGFHGDAAVTVAVGRVSREAAMLIQATREALEEGIGAARHGGHLGDVSWAIQRHVESKGYSVVREYVGHGIGHEMHEDPQVPNYGKPGEGVALRRGMTLALEPMVNIGDWRTRVLEDSWTVITADGSLSAHFEHTIVITDTGAQVLTLP